MKDGKRHFEVMEDECVGCNLCVNCVPGARVHFSLRDLETRRKRLAYAKAGCER